MSKIWKGIFVVTALALLFIIAIAVQTEEGTLVLVKLALLFAAFVAFVIAMLHGFKGWSGYLRSLTDKKLRQFFYLFIVFFLVGFGLKFIHPLLGLVVMLSSAISAGMISTEQRKREKSSTSQEVEK